MHRVHGEATECVVFIGRAWMELAMETRPGVPQNGGNGLVFYRPRSKQDPVHREGYGVPQNGGNRLLLDFLRSKRGPVDREGCGVPQTEEMDLCWSATVKTGVLFIARGVAYRKTGLHGILFISTVNLLQPPRATVHPRLASSNLHLQLFIHDVSPPASTSNCSSMGSCSSGLHCSSTGYCSTSPLHGV